MPYKSTSELGKGKEGLPEGAKKIFMGAFNSAYEQYGESRASAIAWSAVKKKFHKNKEGAWVANTGDEASAVEIIDHDETMLLDVNDAANMQLTKEGFMVAVPRVARTGIQLYKGSEMGIDDSDAVIRVYRPEGEVFDVDALRSLAHRPVTLDHPPEMVDSKNWRKWAVGQLGGDFARDGQFIRFPMTVMDADAVDAIRKGKAQLSVGYTSDILWGDGVTPDGEPYDAMQRSIRANHIAVVGMARGGDKLKIGDDDEVSLRNANRATGRAKDSSATAAHSPVTERSHIMADRDDNTRDNTRTLVIDGVTCQVPEYSAQLIERALKDRLTENETLRKQVDQRETAATQTLSDSRKVMDEKDGTIAALKRQIADLEMTPAKLDKLVRDRQEIVEKARAIMGDSYDCAGRTDVEIKRAVVSAKLGGEVARAMSDEAVSGAFSTLMAANGTNARGNSANLAQALGDAAVKGIHSSADAAEVAYAERSNRLANAWRRNDEKAAS